MTDRNPTSAERPEQREALAPSSFGRRMRCMLVKELAQIRRDRKMFGILIMAPLIQLLVLGYAASTDVREVTVAVRDYDHSYHSREYVRAIGSSGYLKTAVLTGSDREQAAALVNGTAGIVLNIPKGFGRALIARRPVEIQALVDGADSSFAVQGLNYLMSATQLYTEGLAHVSKTARSTALAGPAVRMQHRIWYNPDLKSQLYMVPSIMGVLLLVTTMLVTSMALVKEREDGTLEQLIVTPLRPLEITLGKLLPFAVIGFVGVTVALPVILWVFHVPLNGSLFLLYVGSGLFILNTLGLGLFISTMVKTQQQAMMIAAFFVMMPFILLSGFIFPVENMPAVLQPLSYVIPVKYYLTIVRGVFLKGVGWAELWPDALALLGLGLAILTSSVLKFHKRLD